MLSVERRYSKYFGKFAEELKDQIPSFVRKMKVKIGVMKDGRMYSKKLRAA